MSNNKESDKVIVINARALKILGFIAKILLSLLISIVGTIAISYFVPYWQYSNYAIYNNYSVIGVVIFIITLILIIRIKFFVKLLVSIRNLYKNYILRSIGMEIFIANINSFLLASGVYFIVWVISTSQIIGFLWAIPAYFLVLKLLIRKKINYIKEITDSILEISKGNLDYKVSEKGNDELKILAENINKMSLELKNKIADEMRAEQTKNELITNVSHDLKTPLTTIIGYLTLVKDKTYENDKVMEEYVERAYSKSLRLKKLIEDLFEYTKLSNEVITVNKSAVNLVELMEQLLGEMSVIAKQNKLSFESNYSHAEIIVNIDSDLMARTFENIFSNAIKYSYKELDSKIFVSIVKQEDIVTVIVENQGDTIPTEILPLLFDRFYRVDRSRNSKILGSGLGLAIAKSIVELHGGTIYAESEANRVKMYVELKA